MQVSANDQIGHTPPTHARAYGARARTSNQSMNIPFDVSESSGTEGKINRQDLPIPASKVGGAEYGSPSGGDGNTMANTNINRWPNMLPTPPASPSFIPSQAQAPSSQNYLKYTTAVRLKLADYDVIC